jgi:hypothetical protein
MARDLSRADPLTAPAATPDQERTPATGSAATFVRTAAPGGGTATPDADAAGSVSATTPGAGVTTLAATTRPLPSRSSSADAPPTGIVGAMAVAGAALAIAVLVRRRLRDPGA